MSTSGDPDKPTKSSRPALEGLDPRLLMAEGLGLDSEAPEAGGTPDIPGYEILRLLGSGGMGRVWLARQTSLDRLVAVKVLGSGETAASQWLDRLEREARSMARLSHPNIVAVYDFVRIDGGAAIVMEWVGSGTLREKWLAARKPVRDLGTIAAVIRQIAASLAAAHGAGIVHRDLKPENVLVAVDGSVKVTDFGLALPTGPDQPRLTLTGTSVGTLGYMAPEQLEGRAVDGRADLFSLGVILYEMVTGIRPQGHFDPPRSIRRDLPVALEKLILDSLRTRPQKRVATAEEFLARLERAMHPRSRWLAVAAGFALLTLAGAGTYAWMTGQPREPAASFTDNDRRLGQAGESPLPQSPLPVTPPSPAVSAPEPVAPPAPKTEALAVLPKPEPAPIPDKPTKTAEPVPEPVADAPPEGITLPAAWSNHLALRPVSGNWIREGAAWRSDNSKAVLQLLGSLPPRGFRARVAFTRLEGTYSIAIFFRTPKGTGTAELSAWENSLAGFQVIDGQDLRTLPEAVIIPIENGRRYELELEYGQDRLRMSLDGRTVKELEWRWQEIGVAYPWGWETLDTKGSALAIGSYESPTLFHEITVEEL